MKNVDILLALESKVNVLYDNAGRRSRELFAIRNQMVAYLDKLKSRCEALRDLEVALEREAEVCFPILCKDTFDPLHMQAAQYEVALQAHLMQEYEIDSKSTEYLR
mmetsp:Transcript_2069/g.6292  ORF Transcript_2069/g.6292 Transcript_2069/m.6292 type:complete len:106 (-) Transcript_2069:883-1200(-)